MAKIPVTPELNKILDVEIPVPLVYERIRYFEDTSTMLQFGTGNVRFNSTLFTSEEGTNGLISVTDGSPSTSSKFSVSQRCKVFVFLSMPIDDNGQTGRIFLRKDTGSGPVTIMEGGQHRDERAHVVSATFELDVGDTFDFVVPTGQVFSSTTDVVLTVWAQSFGTVKIGDLI